jgi:hypothetical protein
MVLMGDILEGPKNSGQPKATLEKPSAPAPSYAESRQKEINSLLEKGAFEFVNASEIPKDSRVFGSQFVDEIKNPGTDKALLGGRLVVSGVIYWSRCIEGSIVAYKVCVYC